MPAWNVEIYPYGMESNSVKKYFSSLPSNENAQLLQLIKSLQELGPDLQGTDMDKLIEGSLRELRKGRHRILYGREGNNFVLLVAFMKRTQKTPKGMISLAQERFASYKEEKKKEKLRKR